MVRLQAVGRTKVEDESSADKNYVSLLNHRSARAVTSTMQRGKCVLLGERNGSDYLSSLQNWGEEQVFCFVRLVPCLSAPPCKINAWPSTPSLAVALAFPGV